MFVNYFYYYLFFLLFCKVFLISFCFKTEDSVFFFLPCMIILIFCCNNLLLFKIRFTFHFILILSCCLPFEFHCFIIAYDNSLFFKIQCIFTSFYYSCSLFLYYVPACFFISAFTCFLDFPAFLYRPLA